MEIVWRSVRGSLCFGLYDAGGRQAGFARVVTDCAFPELQGVKRLFLGTRDAHELYKKYGGFVPLSKPELWMEREAVKK